MAATPTPFSWTSLEGRTVIHEIIEERIPEWRTRPAQLDCWSHTLAGIPTILIASTGWGKNYSVFVPILVLQHLLKYPKPQIPKPPISECQWDIVLLSAERLVSPDVDAIFRNEKFCEITISTIYYIAGGV